MKFKNFYSSSRVELSVVYPLLIILTTSLLTTANPERGLKKSFKKLSMLEPELDEDDELFHEDHHVIVSPLPGSTFHSSENDHHFTSIHHSPIQGNCEPIKIGLCMELGYNETTMPNLVGHDAQADADALLQTFTPLIQYGCSPHLKLFLCSSHAPMCTDKTPQPIGPCRSLCESVRRNCEPVLTEFGFKWPPSLDCSKFYPENNHQHMCIPGPMDSTHGGGFGFRIPDWGDSSQTPFVPSGVRNSGSVGMNKPKVTLSNDPSVFRPMSPQTPVNPVRFTPGDVRVKNPTDSNIGDGGTGQEICFGHRKLWSKGTCWNRCNSDFNKNDQKEPMPGLFKINEVNFARNYTLTWAILSLLFTILALTLSFKSPKINTAERPIIYIALCQSMVSIGTIIGTSMSVSCFIDKGSGVELLAGHGMVPSPCAVIFLLTYFFGTASNLWWVILCLSWMLSVNLNLCISLQQKERSIFHLVTWGTASVLTSIALIHKKVDGDELSGLCGVGFQDAEILLFYVLIPAVAILILGLLCLLIGLISRGSTTTWIFGLCCFRSNKSSLGSSGQNSTNMLHTGARHNHAYSPVLLPPPPSSLQHHHHHQHSNCPDRDDSPSFFTSNPNATTGLQLQRRRVMEENKGVWRRISVFAFVCAVTVICSVGAIAYEVLNKDDWENGRGRPNLHIFLIRFNMNLIPGIAAGVWVLSTFPWSVYSQKLCNFFSPKNQIKAVPIPTAGLGVSPSSINTMSPLLIPVPVNSLATSYVTLNGRSQHGVVGQRPPFAGITTRYHQPAVPPLPARNPEPINILEGWRRTETIV